MLRPCRRRNGEAAGTGIKGRGRSKSMHAWMGEGKVKKPSSYVCTKGRPAPSLPCPTSLENHFPEISEELLGRRVEGDLLLVFVVVRETRAQENSRIPNFESKLEVCWGPFKPLLQRWRSSRGTQRRARWEGFLPRESSTSCFSRQDQG